MKKKAAGKYTKEQIEAAEASMHVILMGNDFFSYNGRYVFTKDKAEYFLNQVNDGLLEIMETGSESEKEEAIICLAGLKILPFRIH
jgi:hypothetical protein